MESTAVDAGSTSSVKVDPERELTKVADAIGEVEKAIKGVEAEIKRVKEALEKDEPYLRMTVPRLQEYLSGLMEEKKLLMEKEKLLMEEKKLLMEKEKQLRDKESKLAERLQPGLAEGGPFLTRCMLERRLRDALGEIGTPLDDYVMDKLIRYHGQSLHLYRGEALVDLYNDVMRLPRTSTRQVIESKYGVRLNGEFMSGIPARCHLIVGYEMPAGRSVLVKIPAAADAAKREHAVCRHLWAGGEPKYLVGPMELVECGFHSLDGAAVGDMQLAGDAGNVISLKCVLVMPKYASTVALVPVPHPAEFVLDTGLQINAALEFMHERGYGHCDVKPSNIFMDATGTRHLGDFGASVPLGDALLEGTHNFLPGGESALRLDKASAALDHFSLAVTLLFCCGAWDTAKSLPDPTHLESAAQGILHVELRKLILKLLSGALPR